MEERKKDKVLGALFGQAVGDALGKGFELINYSEDGILSSGNEKFSNKATYKNISYGTAD